MTNSCLYMQIFKNLILVYQCKSNPKQWLFGLFINVFEHTYVVSGWIDLSAIMHHKPHIIFSIYFIYIGTPLVLYIFSQTLGFIIERNESIYCHWMWIESTTIVFTVRQCAVAPRRPQIKENKAQRNCR